MGNLALTIAASGINAQQAAMDTVAENLANASTPGYIQESPTLLATADFSWLGTGTGVTTLGSSQAYDGLLNGANQTAVGALAQTSSLQQVLEGVQSAFPVSTSTGTGSDLSAFWSSWDAAALNPSNTQDRASVVNAAQAVVSDLASSSAQITSSQNDATAQLTTQVGADNALLSQVAALNVQIVVTKGSGASANALVDQQNAIVNQLAQDLGAVGTLQPNGMTTLTVGGVSVVPPSDAAAGSEGNTAATLSVAGSTGTLTLKDGSGATVLPTSGSAAGLLAAVNVYLPGFQTKLDTVANSLATTVNGQLAKGYTASGSSGGPLFTGSGAAGMSVSTSMVATPSLLALSSTGVTPDAANNGANAQAMANLADVTTGPDQAYRAFVQTMGSQVSGVASQVQTQTSVANAAQANLQSVSGVSTNNQEVMMINYQQAYQASATVISTVQTMIESLMAAV